MSNYLPPVTFNNFVLGLNEKPSNNLIDDKELAESVNVFVGPGYIEKRYGYVEHRNTPVSLLYDFYKNNGTIEQLAVSGTNLMKDNGTALVPVTMTNPLTTDKVKLVVYNDRSMNDVVLIADGGKLKTYNGTEVKEVTPHTPSTGDNSEITDPGLNDMENLSAVRSLVINGERIYIVGHPTNKNRVSFSHIDPGLGFGVFDYFPATHFFDLAVDDNDEIVDLELFRQGVAVFCKRSLWMIYGNGRTANDYQITRINVPNGCIAPGSIKRVGNSIFYLSDNHIYALTSTDQEYVSANVTSENITNTLNSISLADKEKAVATFFDDKYYLSFPSGLTVVFDNLIGNWTVFTNIKAKTFLNRSGVLYFGGEKVYKFDKNVFNDDGEPIAAKIVLKNMDFGFQVQDKRFRRMWIVAKQYIEPTSTYRVSAVIDYVKVNIDNIETDQSLVWGEGTWGKSFWGFKEVVKNRLYLGKRGTNFQLVIENDSLDQPFTFYGVTFEYAVKRA